MVHVGRFTVGILTGLWSLWLLSCDSTSIQPDGSTGLNNADSIPPAAVTTLYVLSSTDTSAVLIWTASGDDSLVGTASEYDLRHSTTPITCCNWDRAVRDTSVTVPSVPGELETHTIIGLDSGVICYVGLKVADDAGNCSDLSNVVSVHAADTTAPARIADLSVASQDTASVILTWSAPGDDGSIGIVAAYDIRFDDQLITAQSWDAAQQLDGEPTPQMAGQVQQYQVTDLTKNSTYYFAVKAVDESDNISVLSNVAVGETLDTSAFIWIRSWGGSGNEEAAAVVVTSGGDIVIAGKTDSYGAGYDDVYLVKTDSDGDMLWEKTFGGPTDDYVNDLVIADDGGYVMVGLTDALGSNSGRANLLKTDADGDYMWATFPLDSVSTGRIRALDRVGNSGYILAGSGGGRSKALLMKVDSDGGEEWRVQYKGISVCIEYGYYGEGYGYDVVTTSDTSFVFVWKDISWPWWGHVNCGPPEQHHVIQGVDSGGADIWYRYGQVYSGLEYEGGWVGASWSPSLGLAFLDRQHYYGYALIKTDLVGMIEWETSLESQPRIVPSDLLAHSLSKYIVAGHEDNRAAIVSIDHNGNISNHLVLTGEYHSCATALAEAPDGGIIVAGYMDSGDNGREVLLMKIHSTF
ncbi:MAG: hypothetical protein ABII79_10765 [bacterium]